MHTFTNLQHQRRLIWKYGEVMYFIDILKHKKSEGLFDKRRVRGAYFFNDVETAMNVAGFKKPLFNSLLNIKISKVTIKRDK
ncbi:hypothetical protein NQ314_005811 [Rhamnusium bicolor]|uniref:DUF5659 domain-containing protein n=1 Tax=Rhamnusium bicolor TaxID=1586634 RepID=A0AAV8ZCD1_9CUCU|nr:hypothetical protein NQ314_005811 [Rhamnusium bicolor]